MDGAPGSRPSRPRNGAGVSSCARDEAMKLNHEAGSPRQQGRWDPDALPGLLGMDDGRRRTSMPIYHMRLACPSWKMSSRRRRLSPPLSFFSGGIRFIFELVQLLLETVVTRRLPTDKVDEMEGVMLVQGEMLLRERGSSHIKDLETCLNKPGGKSIEGLRFLRLLLENRYRGVLPWEDWNVIAQDLLVPFGDEVDLSDLTPLTDHGQQWVIT